MTGARKSTYTSVMRFTRAGVQPRGIRDDVVISPGTYSLLPGRTHVASPTSLKMDVNLEITTNKVSTAILEKISHPSGIGGSISSWVALAMDASISINCRIWANIALTW